MSHKSVEMPQKQPDEDRARAHTPHGQPPPGPDADNGTQTDVIETVTNAEAEPVGEAGEAMVALLARRAALPGKAIDAIERALGAKKWSWCKETNSRIYEDDHRAQMEAAKLYLEYVVGRPAERALVITNGNGSSITLDELMASPALRRALARKIESAGTGGVPKGG